MDIGTTRRIRRVTKRHGLKGEKATYGLRPFFRQMPKTMAVDLPLPAGEAVTLFKYERGKNVQDARGGSVISSPTYPPAGECVTRALVKLDGVPDVCSVYS